MTPFELGQLVTTVLSLGVAALGIWVAHKSRQAPLHEALYARQVDAALDLNRAIYTALSAIGQQHQGAGPDAGSVRKAALEIEAQERGWSVILPASVQGKFQKFTSALYHLADVIDESKSEKESVNNAVGVVALAFGELLMEIRDSLGVGGLSKQTARYFAGKRESIDMTFLRAALEEGGVAGMMERLEARTARTK